MHMKSITLNLSPAEDAGLSVRDFDGANVADIVDAAPLTFYVALDHAGQIVGSAQVSAEDRKAIGALVGNWIAHGHALHRMGYKAMNKLLREQQKVLDAASKEPVSVDPESPAPAGSPGQASPGAPEPAAAE